MAFVGSCDCGAVQITVPHVPGKITACTCDFCRKVGANWAYYPKETLSVSGPTQPYMRGAKRLEFHRCVTCGVLTHWTAVTVDWKNSGVNMANFDQTRLKDVPVGPDA